MMDIRPWTSNFTRNDCRYFKPLASLAMASLAMLSCAAAGQEEALQLCANDKNKKWDHVILHTTTKHSLVRNSIQAEIFNRSIFVCLLVFALHFNRALLGVLKFSITYESGRLCEEKHLKHKSRHKMRANQLGLKGPDEPCDFHAMLVST